MERANFAVSAGVGAWIVACTPPPSSLVELRDPDGFAAGAVELQFEVRNPDDRATLWSGTRPVPDTFPVTITLASADKSEVYVVATAVDGNGRALARGYTTTRLSASTTPAALVLGEACESSCNDGLFCNGEETCTEGVCIRAVPPCQSNFDCVLSTCVEETDECSTTVDQAVCDFGDGISRFCSPSSGCIEGKPCKTDDECQDEFICNGREVCTNFSCAGGESADPNDGSPCTIDGCNDAREDGALFNTPDPSRDGNACTREDGGEGICLSSAEAGCVASVCGDGFRDPFREPCDDGNADNTDGCIKTETSPGEFGCALAVCGDGHVQAGVEACDDDNTQSGDGCRGDCMKVELCGDGELDEGEACDDGNDNPNDSCNRCRRTAWAPHVVTGFGESGDDPLNVGFWARSVTFDRRGNLFAADPSNHRIWRIDGASGFPTVVAGTGSAGFTGDGGPATSAKLDSPLAVAVDGLGNLFIADFSNHRIRQVCAGDGECPAGTIRTVAGGGNPADGLGDGGPATSARLDSPVGITIDGLGNLFIADAFHYRIRQVCAGDGECPAGTIRTVAGGGNPADGLGDGGPATSAQLSIPQGIAFDGLGNLFISDGLRIRQVCAGDAECPAGTIRTVAGGGNPADGLGDGGPATSARLDSPVGIAIDGLGNLFIADSTNRRIRQVCAGDDECTAGTIRTVAGGGNPADGLGDGGPATSAQLSIPLGIAVDGLGNLFIADFSNHRIRQVCAGDDECTAGTIRTVAGTGAPRFIGDSGSATSALLSPYGIAVDGLGNLFVADSLNGRIRQVCAGDGECPAGTIRTVAGGGNPGGFSDGSPATSALLSPYGIAVDVLGNLFISDGLQVHQVCAGDGECTAGTLRTVAGVPNNPGFSGDGGPATSAQLNAPVGIAVDGLGNLFIADASNDRIRQVCAGDGECPAGTIRTVAGGGNPADGLGDGLPATSAQLDSPVGIVVDGLGNLFIADTSNGRIRQVCAGIDGECPNGTIRTVAGGGTPTDGLGDGGPATSARLNDPVGIAVDGLGNLFIAESTNRRIRQVCAGDDECTAGTIRTVAGGGNPADGLGDGGPATSARLGSPVGIAVDGLGNLFIADRNDHRIRQVCAGDDECSAGTIRTVAGEVDPTDGPLERAALGEPLALVALGNQWLIADGVSGRVRALDFADNRLTTVVGYPDGFTADDALARYSRLLGRPRGIAADPELGRLYVSESDRHTIRRVNTSVTPWTIERFSGGGTAGFADAEEPGTEAAFAAPTGLLFDAENDRLLVADRDNHVIRAIDTANGATTTLVGVPRTRGFAGDGGEAQDALLNSPEALAFGPDGSLYLTDTGNNRVRRVDSSGLITTVLGDGTRASSGAGSPARFFPVDTPLGVALDSYGNLFVTSSTTLRRVTAGIDGIATGEDAVDTIYGAAPRTDFPSSVTNCLSGVAVADAPDGTPEARLIVLDACVGFALTLERVHAEP